MPDTTTVAPGIRPVESVQDGMPAGWPRLFAVATITIGLSMSLLADRTFQGLGGAAIMSVQPALVRAIYPRNMLGRGLGFNTTVVATSLAAGPSLGAALLTVWSWPVLF